MENLVLNPGFVIYEFWEVGNSLLTSAHRFLICKMVVFIGIVLTGNCNMLRDRKALLHSLYPHWLHGQQWQQQQSCLAQVIQTTDGFSLWWTTHPADCFLLYWFLLWKGHCPSAGTYLFCLLIFDLFVDHFWGSKYILWEDATFSSALLFLMLPTQQHTGQPRWF